MPDVDILVPTCDRVSALAVTLTSLAAQSLRSFRVVVSDQGERSDVADSREIEAVARLLRLHGHDVVLRKHLPRRGMAEQREFLLEAATAPYSLFLDDDVLLEPGVVARLLRAIREERCGFVGCALIGLSYLDDVRPDEEQIELWDGPVRPERVVPGSPQWKRHRLHNAANLYHVQQRLGASPERQRKYHVAWVGGCVLYDTAALRDCGGFGFWHELPREHCGEDVLAQLRVMARYGGCGLIPSGAYHLELPTTISDRRTDAPKVLACS
jgi:GT2 family glycosyltransferase